MPIWNIDPDHSVAAFSIKHMMIADVHGQFNGVSGVIHFDPADISATSFEMKIDAAGIYTGIQKRDDHLKSADFFEVETYPHITFKSSHAERLNFNSCRITGDLTFHGITQPFTADVEFFGSIKSPFGETSMGFTARTVVNREDFGLTWNEPMENSGFMVGRDVRIFVELEADLAE